MPKLFISYRRDDSKEFTEIIYNYMTNHFNKDDIFFDKEGIKAGENWQHVLNDAVEGSDVLIVIIGPKWLKKMQERASQEETDWVVFEIQRALETGKIIIPVWIKEAEPPSSKVLPEAIRDLETRQGYRIHDDQTKDNCKTLAEKIKERLWETDPVNTMQDEIIARIRPLLPPPFDLVAIPKGQVCLEYGGYLADDTCFEVSNYLISKYPVTNQQYAKFIAKGGYENNSWWSSAGWIHKKNNNWSAPDKWNLHQDKIYQDHPVVGVSWYEANAFCNWLSSLVRQENKDIKNAHFSITLPTDQQWQRAAQGNDDRAYPWGDDWNRSRCNNSVDSNSPSETTPVIEYEGVDKGSSPFGVADMAGNVWEWCLTTFETGSNDQQGTDKRVVRGGGHDYRNEDFFRIDIRDHQVPDFRHHGYGFRIVISNK